MGFRSKDNLKISIISFSVVMSEIQLCSEIQSANGNLKSGTKIKLFFEKTKYYFGKRFSYKVPAKHGSISMIFLSVLAIFKYNEKWCIHNIVSLFPQI